jgi:hypothetical protein
MALVLTRGRSQRALWAALLALGWAGAIVAQPLGGAAPPAARGLVRDGLAATYQLLILAAALGAVVLSAYDTRRRPQPGWVLLCAGAGCLTVEAVTPGWAVTGLLGGGAALLGLLRAGGAARSADEVWLGSGALAFGAGVVLLVLPGGAGRIDRLALAASEQGVPGEVAAGCALLAVGAIAGAVFLGRVAGRPSCAPALAAALWIPVLAATAVGGRLALGLPFVTQGLEWGGVSFKSAGAVVAGLLVLVGYLQAGRSLGLRDLLGGVLLGQAGLAALLAPTASAHVDVGGPVLAGGGPALTLALAAGLPAFLGLCALAQVGEEELGGTEHGHLRGLARRNPYLAGWAGLLTLSLVGCPATVGFVALVAGLQADLAGGLLGPAALVCAGQAALAWGGGRLLVTLVGAAADGDGREPLVTSPGLTLGLCVLATLVVVWGLGPAGLVGFTQQLRLG